MRKTVWYRLAGSAVLAGALRYHFVKKAEDDYYAFR